MLLFSKSIAMLFDDAENMVSVGIINAASKVIHFIDACVIFSFHKERYYLISIKMFSMFFENFLADLAGKQVRRRRSIECF